MQAFGVPRLDAGAEGIHLLWTWPDVLPLSEHGFDIQRLDERRQRWESRCEDIDERLMLNLRMRREYPAPLGLLRMRTGVRFRSLLDELQFPAHVLRTPGAREVLRTHLAQASATVHFDARAVSIEVDAFIQELDRPVERASVQASGRAAVVMAMRAGKVVKLAFSARLPATMLLQAPSIDTIVVYIVAPRQLRICVFDRVEDVWSQAPYIERGLTLPIHEADPSLTVGAQEYAAARARLVAGESLEAGDFDRLAATLRDPATHAHTRSGERIVLVRSDTGQSYEEMPFETQLAGLVVHPKARRVLGFGYRDHQHLVAGQPYTYRITGRYRAEDLTDAIYDVHRVPASTVLPSAFSIRDLAFRFQTPVKVVLDPAPPTKGLHAVSRRGIRIDTKEYDASWDVPSFDGWSALIGFPHPVSKVVLEVAPGHSFKWAAGLPWAFGSPTPTALGAGPRIELSFASPVLELRLSGTGTLYAVRIPSGATGLREVHAYTEPIVYAAEPLPAPPAALSATTLQSPPVTISGTIDESTAVPERPQVGFELRWLPAPAAGLTIWPSDLDAGPPLDSIAYRIEQRTVTLPSTYGPWKPIAGDDNLTLGSRDDQAPTVRLEHGCDLDALFPAVRPRSPDAGFTLRLSDVFGEKDPTGLLRPMPPLGSHFQYQIRSVDAVGRVSATATDSNVARLEKHVPPPLPVGPQPEAPLDANGHLAKPPGPRARAIVAGAPGLTAADLSILGSHQNAILLEWGWRAQEREIDPDTAEFRVYSTIPQDVVEATVSSVVSSSPHWKLTMTTNVPLVADELVGQWLSSGGYPYLITQNGAGTSVSVLVELSKLDPSRAPVTGAITFGRPLRAEHQRARGWDQRVATYPLTSADSYQHVFYDVLALSPSHPRDSIWVGVSSADAEPYVADERTTGANANRPGNESGIVTVAIVARYRGQPTFSVPPPLGDVPEIVTDEPTGRQVIATLDVATMLGGALPAGAPIALARCSADDVLSRTQVVGSNVVLTHPDGSTETIAFANPSDDAEVLATLNSANPQRLANKFLVHLLAASSQASAYFQRVSADILQVGTVEDRLPPKPGRFLYFVHGADALGHVSEGGAFLPMVVRVPSTAAAPLPTRRSLSTSASAATLTAAVPADPDTGCALLFAAIAPPGANPPVQGDAELLRLPNRRDLYPNDGIRLRLSDGTLLAPALVKDLTDPDVIVEPDGTRVASLTVSAPSGAWVTLWCFALTRDGFPSHACGPFGTGVR